MTNDEMLSEGWETVCIGNHKYFTIVMGQSPPSKTYNLAGVGLPFFQGKAEFGNLYPTPNKYCSEPSRVAEQDDILISVRAPVGPTNMANCTCCIGRGLAAIRCREKILPKFLLYALRNQEIDIAGSVKDQGGGFTAIRRDQLEAIKIPVPPLDEQHRIVSRINALTQCSEESIDGMRGREDDIDNLLHSMYSQMIADAERKPLGTVATLVRRKVETKPEERYEEMGVRSFGKGTFKKPILTGKQIGEKRIYRIHEGDLVFNNVFAWEGAIAVAQREDHGRVGSHRFITYIPKAEQATSEFLCHHFLSARGLEDIGAASPGSAGRNRTLGLEKLDRIMIPVPGFSEQVRFKQVAEIRREVDRISSESIQDLKKLIPSIVAKAFKGEL